MFPLALKADGSVNKTATIRNAQAHLIAKGRLIPQDPLPHRVRVVRAFLETEQQLAVLEHGVRAPYMLYKQALYIAIKAPKHSAATTLPHERLMEIETAIQLLTAERETILTTIREQETEEAKKSVRTLIKQGWTLEDIQKWISEP